MKIRHLHNFEFYNTEVKNKRLLGTIVLSDEGEVGCSICMDCDQPEKKYGRHAAINAVTENKASLPQKYHGESYRQRYIFVNDQDNLCYMPMREYVMRVAADMVAQHHGYAPRTAETT